MEKINSRKLAEIVGSVSKVVDCEIENIVTDSQQVQRAICHSSEG